MEKVLIIEDEVIIALRFSTYFKQSGYEITDSVTTGEEAILSAKKNTPDLIIADIGLAGEINGIQAIEEIYKQKEIPIIFVTAYQNEEYKEMTKQFKTIGFFVKPIDLETIAIKLQEYLLKNK